MLDDQGDAGRWGLSVVAFVAATLVLYFFWRTPRTDDRILGSLALLLAGIVGNVTDRLRLGFVIDFIDVQFGSWHYPTFNVADAAICIGAGLLMIDMFLTKKKAKCRRIRGNRNPRPQSAIKQMYPELFRIGNFPITTYGIFLAVGMLLAAVCRRRGWRHVTDCRRNGSTISGCGLWSAGLSGQRY